MATSPIDNLMNADTTFGLYLFKKENQEQKVLKDLLQFLKTNTPGKGNSFSYIEAETSLHPHLNLWENLQIELGVGSWREFKNVIKPEWMPLVNLIRSPDILAENAETWEKFIVSLLKGLISQSQSLLIDMNEELLSPFLIQSFKKCILLATKEKAVYLATANSSLWLDCAHTLVDRHEYKFVTERLNTEHMKKHWVA